MSFTNFFKLTSLVHSKTTCAVSKKVFQRNSSALLINSIISKDIANCRHVSSLPQPLTKNNDLNQAFMSFKYLRLIKKAIKELGPVVEENKKLQVLLHKAQEHKIPSDFIDFITRISVESRATVGLLEVLLSSNCHFIVQYEDIDNAISKHHLMVLCEQSDAQLIHDNLKWPKNFDQKGIISVRKDISPLPFNNIKEAKMVAVSAQSVTEEIDPEGIPLWKFYCDPSDLHQVKRHLTEKNCEIEEAFVGYVPKREIMVPNHVKNAAPKFIAALNKVPTIDNVYINIKL